MNSKHYIGTRVSSLDLYDEIGPITGVAMLLDDGNEIFAGNESGYVLEMECPYATQAMANAVLASVSNGTYKGYRAPDASLGIDAELGDGVTVNGIYSMLAYQRLNFGPGHISEIAAPGENAVDHEYPYLSPAERKAQRARNAMWSAIEKNTESINLEVGKIVDELKNYSTIEMTAESIELAVSESKGYADGKYTELKLTIDGFTVTDPNGTTKISGSSIETDTLYVKAANIEGELIAAKLQGDKVNVVSSSGVIYGEMSVAQNGALYILSGVASGFLLGGTNANPVVTCLGSFYAENVIADNLTTYIENFETRISRLERLFG